MRIAVRALACCLSLALVGASVHEASAGAAAVAVQATGQAVPLAGMPLSPTAGQAGLLGPGALTGGSNFAGFSPLHSALPSLTTPGPVVSQPLADQRIVLNSGLGPASLAAQVSIRARATPEAAIAAVQQPAAPSKRTSLGRVRSLAAEVSRLERRGASLEGFHGSARALWEGGGKRAAGIAPSLRGIDGSLRLGRLSGLKPAGMDQGKDAPEPASVDAPAPAEPEPAKRPVFKKLWF